MERDVWSGGDPRQQRLIAVGALGGLLLVSLLLRWFSASSPYGNVDASGWEALTIGRLVLAALVLFAAALSVEGLRGRLSSHRLDGRDMAHLVAALGALGATWIAFRLLVPPHFAEVRSSSVPGGLAFGDFGSTTDEAATDAIDYTRTAAGWMALAASAGLGWLGYRFARDEPGGFDVAHIWAVVRDGRSGWDKLRYQRPEPVTAAAAPEAAPRAFCEQCGAGFADSEGFCVQCGSARSAITAGA